MENKLLKKLIVTLTVIAILATDVYALGTILSTGFSTFASELSNKTDNPNVEFLAYFKDEKGTKVDSIDHKLNAENLKLYTEVAIKNDGYFNGALEIKNSNFKIKNMVITSELNKKIESIQENKINLKQINAGEKIEIELDIEPIISDKITTDFLFKTSTISLSGIYTYSDEEDGKSIYAEKNVSVNFQADENVTPELQGNIITNKIFEVSGKNKRVVQVLLKSRLGENKYPIKQTTLKLNIPNLSELPPEKVNVLASDIAGVETWKNENGIVEIVINNQIDSTNQITWNKNYYDEMIVTFIYAETVDASNIQTTATSQIELYDSLNTKLDLVEPISINIAKEINNIFFTKSEINTPEIYKGQLYANITAENKKDIEYKTTTTLVVTNSNIANQMIIKDGIDLFKTENNELNANGKYISSKINKAKVLKLLGDNGNISIKDGETTIVIDKNKEADDEGNILIQYNNFMTELEITVNNLEKEGKIEIQHTKALTENTYKRTELKAVRTLSTKNTVVVTDIIENSAESYIELKETTTKANLTVNKEYLTTTMENTGLVMGIELVTDGEQYDLYKDPIIKVQLPDAVESVVHNESLLNDENKDFTVNSNYDNSNKMITIKLDGEQEDYSQEDLYLQLDLDVKLNKLASSQTDEIKVLYQNQNATEYYGDTTDIGLLAEAIEISAPTGVIPMFNLDINPDTTTEHVLMQKLTKAEAGKVLNFETIVLNNTDTDISNVRILGKLPTTGFSDNSLETTLQSITAENATIYYTSNEYADIDTEKQSNKWTTDLSSVSNVKLYLIKIDYLSKGQTYTANTKIKLPDALKPSTESYISYDVIYNTPTGTDMKKYSRKILLFTNVKQNVNPEIFAKIGTTELKDGDIVKEGEVITYTAKVTNNTKQVLQNVILKAGVPEGTVVVETMGNYVYMVGYYEEKPEIKEMATTIPHLEAGQTYTMEYNVRVKTGSVTGLEISNTAKAIYDNVEAESLKIRNKLQDAEIRITLKRTDDENIKLQQGGTANYAVYVENITNYPLENIRMKIISNGFTAKSIRFKDEILSSDEMIIINEIAVDEMITFKISGEISKEINELFTYIDIDNCKSNTIKETFTKIGAIINLTSEQNNAFVKKGDIIDYNIVVKNTGEQKDTITVENRISEYLEIQSISINGNITEQITNSSEVETYKDSISNYILKSIELEPNEESIIDIKVKVKEIPEDSNITVITNCAQVKASNIIQQTSDEIIHIVKREETQIEGLENMVTGVIWLDENLNGQRDEDEKGLDRVNVTIYDLSINNYYCNEEGNLLQTTTDDNGRYILTKIPKGSYIIVFEDNIRGYLPTTYMANNVDSNSKSNARLQNISINGVMKTVAATEIINIKNNINNVNAGFRASDIENSKDITKKTISGFVWIDENNDGRKDDTEKVLSGTNVKLVDNNGNEIKVITDNRGQYYFSNIEKSSYKVIFEYDTEKYKPTTYYQNGVENERSSKAVQNNENGVIITSTDTLNVQNELTDINLGLISIITEQPEEPEIPDEPDIPEEPEIPDVPDTPTEPEIPDEPEKPIETKIISGLAWLDENINGKKDENEKLLSGIKVKIYDVSTKKYLTNSDGNIIETTTDENGKYVFNKIQKGSYILIFEYDTEKYELTKFIAENVDTTVNSKVILKKININGKEVIASITDIIKLQENVFNINIGLKENFKFDLELNKYISKVVVQTNKNTKTYDFENSNFEKIEIHRKQINGSLVVIEYTIKIKNNGEMTGCVQNVVDYLPKGLTFSSELNNNWYISNGQLYTKSLENVEIKPGEEKELKLILTKTMTGDTIGLINNRAEIYQHYNKYGNSDIDSTPNNQVQTEDDIGVADIIIAVSTGGSIWGYILLLLINAILIVIAVKIINEKEIMFLNKKGRR